MLQFDDSLIKLQNQSRETWNPPTSAGGGMRCNSREVALIQEASGSCRRGLHYAVTNLTIKNCKLFHNGKVLARYPHCQNIMIIFHTLLLAHLLTKSFT